MGVFFKCTDSASFVIPKVWFAGDFGATCLDFHHFSSPAGLSCQSISSRLGNAFPSAPNLYSFISFPSLSLTYLSALDFPTSCNLFLFLPFGLPFCITMLSPFWPSPDMFICLGPHAAGRGAISRRVYLSFLSLSASPAACSVLLLWHDSLKGSCLCGRPGSWGGNLSSHSFRRGALAANGPLWNFQSDLVYIPSQAGFISRSY